MKNKRILVSLLTAFCTILFVFGMFVPSTAKAVYQNKQEINRQSCSDENFTYLLITYSDYSAEIEVRANRDINTSDRISTSQIYLTRLAYNTDYQKDGYWSWIEENNNEIFTYVPPSGFVYWTNAHVATLKLEPTSTGTLYYDTSFIRIGDHIFNPINLEDRAPQYTPILDLNGDGAFNVADPQFLLEFYLRAYVMEEFPVSEEGFNAFKTEYWRERNDVL